MGVGIWELFVGILVIIILAVLFFKLAPGLKGDIALHLGNTTFRPGHDIPGTITVTAKKALGPGQLVVSLICTEEWEEWTTDHDGDRRRETKRKEIYRHDVPVATALCLNPGDRHDGVFSLPTPQPQDTVAPDPNESGWTKAFRVIVDAVGQDRETYWDVVARYDIKGLDLNAKERIPLHYE